MIGRTNALALVKEESGDSKYVDRIIIDQTATNTVPVISGDVGGPVIRWIRSNSHRVLAKKTAEGELTYCRLNDSDSSLYYEGTAAALDGSEGDVFMKMPEFWYKGTEGDVVKICFALRKLDEDYIRWDPNTLIGVYESYATYGSAFSRSGVASTGSLSQAYWKDYAAARGTGYQLIDWQMHCVMGCLYYAMYGNTDCQGSIGAGTDSYQKDTGQTDSLGMTDTVAGGNGDSQSVNFWGLENWWGNKFEWIHDYLNPAGTLTATVNDPVNGGTRALPIFGYYNADDDDLCPRKLKFGRYLDLIVAGDDPQIVDANYESGYCDYQYWPGSTSRSDRIMDVSGGSKEYGGVSFAEGSDSPTEAYTNICSRLAFRGTCVEETDITTFKGIQNPAIVLIEATNGNLYRPAGWTGSKTANAIVVVADGQSFRIALTESSSTKAISNSSSTSFSMTEYSTEAKAVLDMKSSANTANILNAVSSTSYAAGYCNAFTFPDKSTKGLLPALGWLVIAYRNKDAINACLSACGATEMFSSGTYYWSSTYYGESFFGSYMWIISSSGVNDYEAIAIKNNVRPFAAY